MVLWNLHFILFYTPFYSILLPCCEIELSDKWISYAIAACRAPISNLLISQWVSCFFAPSRWYNRTAPGTVWPVFFTLIPRMRGHNLCSKLDCICIIYQAFIMAVLLFLLRFFEEGFLNRFCQWQIFFYPKTNSVVFTSLTWIEKLFEAGHWERITCQSLLHRHWHAHTQSISCRCPPNKIKLGISQLARGACLPGCLSTRERYKSKSVRARFFQLLKVGNYAFTVILQRDINQL